MCDGADAVIASSSLRYSGYALLIEKRCCYRVVGNLMFPSGSAWADPDPRSTGEAEDAAADGVENGGGEFRARLADGLRVIDFQHFGVAPVAFEVLYFILHCLPMWSLDRDQIPWLLQGYVDMLVSSSASSDGDSPGRHPVNTLTSVTVEALMEEMLAIVVEYYAAFLADDCYDSRQPDSSLSRASPGLQTLSVSAVAGPAEDNDRESRADRTTTAACTASTGMVRTMWSFSTAASARSYSAALTRAAQVDLLLDLGMLLCRWASGRCRFVCRNFRLWFCFSCPLTTAWRCVCVCVCSGSDLLFAPWGAGESDLGTALAS